MTGAIQQLFSTYPILQTIWDAFCVVIPLGCLLAFSGIFFMSSTAKILGISRNRPSYDKCSRQTAFLGMILGWALLIGSRVWLYFTQAQHLPGTLESFMLELGWMLLSLGVLLSSIYYTLWRILKNMPVLHTTLGMICGAQNCLTLAAVLFSIRISAAVISPETQNIGLPDLFPDTWEAPLWSALCYTLPLIFAMSGAFCAVWLALRRRHDDYGRDYYNTMLPWCCAWARNSWCILWLLLLASTSLQLWNDVNAQKFSEQEAIVESIRLLLWLLPILLWTICLKSGLPLRQRWAAYLALPVALGFVLPYFLEITLM